jgi:hypothetical protein
MDAFGSGKPGRRDVRGGPTDKWGGSLQFEVRRRATRSHIDRRPNATCGYIASASLEALASSSARRNSRGTDLRRLAKDRPAGPAIPARRSRRPDNLAGARGDSTSYLSAISLTAFSCSRRTTAFALSARASHAIAASPACSTRGTRRSSAVMSSSSSRTRSRRVTSMNVHRAGYFAVAAIEEDLHDGHAVGRGRTSSGALWRGHVRGRGPARQPIVHAH